jgi:hypothetical protein
MLKGEFYKESYQLAVSSLQWAGEHETKAKAKKKLTGPDFVALAAWHFPISNADLSFSFTAFSYCGADQALGTAFFGYGGGKYAFADVPKAWFRG